MDFHFFSFVIFECFRIFRMEILQFLEIFFGMFLFFSGWLEIQSWKAGCFVMCTAKMLHELCVVQRWMTLRG